MVKSPSMSKFAPFRAYKASLEALLEHLYPYPLTYAILDRYADIRRTLRPVHQDIGDIDTLIAATTIEHNLTLMTIDRDFERVPSLKMQLVNLKAAWSGYRPDRKYVARVKYQVRQRTRVSKTPRRLFSIISTSFLESPERTQRSFWASFYYVIDTLSLLL
jgi:PIN domain